MSRESVVAKRYAKAMYEIAAQEERTLEVEQELRALVLAMSEDVAVQQFIVSPNISETAKWEVLGGVLEGKLSVPVVSLAKLLVERGRTDVLPELLNSYIKVAGDALGLANATVYSTYALSDEEKRSIEVEFGTLVNKKIRVLNVVDSDLLGGMKVRIGDTLYDGSLSGKLKRLEKSFRRQAL
ncbi:F-type H+-transporting ATPase subunit delta [Paenibacillus anaericanus]|uniref:F0F1 ATP synthase subunit delta n=1 Tax=Paenibacillus anaericanus TaxID=170367 RepID=UPI002781D88E|nr:F0F1 ATP synthase subunit delta [Paenibacillus anaericanus]MDQ0089844.1 F-type H+-transporting ATPase subunit delta [Paenibacillus anaericanus]